MELISDLIKDLHPITVHFPIGLLTIVFLFSLLAQKWEYFAKSLPALLAVGTLSFIPVVLGGLRDGNKINATGELSVVLDNHRTLGLMTAAYFVLFSGYVLYRLYKNRNDTFANTRQFLVLAFVGFVLLTLTGGLGGRLVHEFGILTG